MIRKTLIIAGVLIATTVSVWLSFKTAAIRHQALLKQRIVVVQALGTDSPDILIQITPRDIEDFFEEELNAMKDPVNQGASLIFLNANEPEMAEHISTRGLSEASIHGLTRHFLEDTNVTAQDILTLATAEPIKGDEKLLAMVYVLTKAKHADLMKQVREAFTALDACVARLVQPEKPRERALPKNKRLPGRDEA